MKTIGIGILFLTFSLFASENCTEIKRHGVCDEKVVVEKVKWACSILKEKKEQGLAQIKSARYDCCGEPNYFWIDDPKRTDALIHPVKQEFNNRKLKGFSLEIHNQLLESAKKNPEGAWVEYRWFKFGESERTPKKSWVMSCEGKILGSGTWKQ